LRGVQVDISGWTHQADSIGQSEVLENLLCVDMGGVCCSHKAPDQGWIVKRLGGLEDAIPAIRYRQAFFFKEVLAIEQELMPSINRYGGIAAREPGKIQGACVKSLFAQAIYNIRCGPDIQNTDLCPSNGKVYRVVENIG